MSSSSNTNCQLLLLLLLLLGLWQILSLCLSLSYRQEAGGQGEVNLCRDLITKWLPVTVTSTVDIRYVPVLAMAKQKFSPVVLGKLMNLLCKIDN